MDALTRGSSVRRAHNHAARGALVCGLLGVALPVAAFAAAHQLQRVSLVQATAASCGSVVLGLAAFLLARRGRLNLDRTLGRVGGRGTARAGQALGFLALCIGVAAAVALGFYELLTHFR
jgi:hypothetical protein